MGAPARIAFIGAGKVGCSLARYLGDAGAADVAGFFSRSQGHAEEAAAFAGGVAFESALDAVYGADLVFITTPDGAIAQTASEVADECREAGIPLAGKLFAHCSGALGSDALAPLRKAGAAVASCHPLYAVSSRFGCWRELKQAWFTLEGDDEAVEVLEALLAGCGNRCVRIPAAEKPRYHAAAVMASNLVVALYDRAAAELETCGFARADAEAALAPLFLGNAEHIAVAGPAGSLTGPAARGDDTTIEKHLACLDGADRQIYALLTDAARDLARRR